MNNYCETCENLKRKDTVGGANLCMNCPFGKLNKYLVAFSIFKPLKNTMHFCATDAEEIEATSVKKAIELFHEKHSGNLVREFVVIAVTKVE